MRLVTAPRSKYSHVSVICSWNVTVQPCSQSRYGLSICDSTEQQHVVTLCSIARADANQQETDMRVTFAAELQMQGNAASAYLSLKRAGAPKAERGTQACHKVRALALFAAAIGQA